LQLFDFECCKILFSKRDTPTGHLNQHADIHDNTFAFGVILLEIISGQLPYSKEKIYLADWVSQPLPQPDSSSKCPTKIV
jgi:hypothetical protein